MALLKIIKLTNNVWKHNSDKDGDFILTKFYAKEEFNKFLIVESYGSKRRNYLINEIEVYDIGGSAETFTTFDSLFVRLKELGYTGYYEDGTFIFVPSDYISNEVNNALVMGADGKYFVPNSGGASTELGKIRIVDKLGEFFTNLATASAYVSSFTLATLTDESFSNGVYYFTVPNGTSFAELDYFLIGSSAYIEDSLGLINQFGNICFDGLTGNNIFGDCTFGNFCFSDASGNNTFGNCTFGENCFQDTTGNNKFKNILLSNPTDYFGDGATGRFEIYGNIGTTEAANYTNFFAGSNATIWVDKSKETSNAGGLEGDLATAQANGATLFFGYAPPLNNAFTDIVDLGSVTGAVSIDWSLGVKHKLNLTGNITITQTNYAAFEGQKVQEIQITSSSPSYTITWVDVDPLDFTDAIDFTTGTTYNNVSVRLLRSNIFQSNNFVR